MPRDWEEWMVTVIVIAVMVLLGVGVCFEAKNPCLEWEETGGYGCFGDQNFQQCTPDKRCVRRTYE